MRPMIPWRSPYTAHGYASVKVEGPSQAGCRRNNATVMSFSAVDAEFVSDVFGGKGFPSPAFTGGALHSAVE